ncbi:MAG: UDP-2,3-diacylglucosamine diphosphatase LpxI [Pseudomonadota bacterium]
MSERAATPVPVDADGAGEERASVCGGPSGPLAIVAGRGALPRALAEARAKAGMPYLLVVFAECFEPWMADHPHQHHRFEKAGRLFAALAEAGAEGIVFAGAMNRPRLRPWAADWTALSILPRALALLARGDDAMLRGFAALFEDRGLRLYGAQEVLGGSLALPAGVIGKHSPSARARADAVAAAAIVTALAPHEVGQGAVVANGLCLAVEAVEGTDLMLARLADLPPARRRRAPPPSGVLVKIPKPAQDLRLDTPTIGPQTVRAAAAAGLSGIVGLAGATQVLDRAETAALADAKGLFVWGATAADLGLEAAA